MSSQHPQVEDGEEPIAVIFDGDECITFAYSQAVVDSFKECDWADVEEA